MIYCILFLLFCQIFSHGFRKPSSSEFSILCSHILENANFCIRNVYEGFSTEMNESYRKYKNITLHKFDLIKINITVYLLFLSYFFLVWKLLEILITHLRQKIIYQNPPLRRIFFGKKVSDSGTRAWTHCVWWWMRRIWQPKLSNTSCNTN